MAYKHRIKHRIRRLKSHTKRKSIKSGILGGGRMLKQVAKGSLALSVARRIIPDVAGKHQLSLDLIGAGAMLKLLGAGGNNLISTGAVIFGANILDTNIIPLVSGVTGQVSQQPQIKAIYQGIVA